MTKKAPEYYDEVQAQLKGSGGLGGLGGGEEAAGKEGMTATDFWYDVAGWALLGAAVVGGIALARGSMAATAK